MKNTLLSVACCFFCGASVSRAQLPVPQIPRATAQYSPLPSTAGNHQYISKITLWRWDDAQREHIEVTCITPLGNHADLAAYINLNFRYLNRCVEMMAEGRMFYKVSVNASGGLDSLTVAKPIPGCEDKQLDIQVESALKALQKIDANGQTRQFLVEVDITVVPPPVIRMNSILPNW